MPFRRPTFSPAFVALFYKMLVVLGIFHLAMQLCYSLPVMLARTDNLRDVVVYYDAAVRLKDGIPVYQPWPEYGVQMTPFRFFYPPPFLLLTRPLAGLDFLTFAKIWTILILGAFWVYSACLAKLATGRWDWRWILVFATVIDLAFRGYATLSLGQFEPFMWMFFGLALATKNRIGFLALATMVKIHPIWSLGVALYREKSRTKWLQLALWTIPILVASWFLVGTQNWLMWWPSTSPIASQGTFNADNVSISYFGLRLLSWMGLLEPSGKLPALAKLYLSVCTVVGPLVTMYLARKQSEKLQIALTMSAGILFAPLCWTLYLPLLLLPVAIWWGERTARQDSSALARQVLPPTQGAAAV